MRLADTSGMVTRALTVTAELIMLCALIPVLAQTTQTASDPQVDAGTKQNGTYDGLHDNVSLPSGNLSFCIPLVSLPGINGHNLTIPLCYNSQFMEVGGATGQSVTTVGWFPWVWGPNTPHLGPGWALNARPGLNASAQTSANGTPIAFMADGSKLSFPSEAGGQLCLCGPDGQMAGMYLASTGSTLKLYLKDGTIVSGQLGSNNSLVTDTNGNQTSYTPASVTDPLGRTVTVTAADASGSSPAYIAFRYPDPSGSGSTVSVTVQVATMQFACSGVGATGTYAMPTSVVFPNGRSYQFQYDSCGMLQKVIYPSGGYTRYDYTVGSFDVYYNNQPVGNPQNEVAHRYLCPAAVGSNQSCTVPEETTAYTPVSGTYNNSQTTVVDPVGNKTIYQFSQASAVPFTGIQAVETNRVMYDASGTFLRSIQTQYATTTAPYCNGAGGVGDPSLPTVQTTTLDNGLVSQIQWDYDCWSPAEKDSVLIEAREYDYGSGAPGSLLRKTDYTWLQRDNPTAYGWPTAGGAGGANILDHKTSETVYDGSGNLVSQIKYIYDGSNSGGPGELTSVRKLVTYESGPSNWLTTQYSYNANGTLAVKTDPENNTTTYSYTDNFADKTGTNTQALPTAVSYSNGWTTHTQYYWSSGQVAASCGANFVGNCEIGLNGVPDYASFTYDSMGRKLSSLGGDGSKTTQCYSDDIGSSCANGGYPVEATTSELITAGVSKVSTVVLDGEGRTVQTQLNSDANCSGGSVNVDTTYDADGRVATVTNPYCSTNPNASTAGTTSYVYDGLGRKTQINNPDGTYSTVAYTGRATLVSDEGNGTTNIRRVSQSDALGRLSAVCEVTNTVEDGSSSTPSSCGLDISASGFLTHYAYDLLGNLVSVQQGSVTRSFTYDSISELRSATNPESGTTLYSYDNDGNVSSKTSAAGVTTTYTYDHLNRLIGKSYSDGTPSACYQYDQGSTYGISRLTAEWTQSGNCSSSVPVTGAITERLFPAYDLMGRVITDKQCSTPGNCSGTPYTVGYSYDLAGDIISSTNGLVGSSAMSFASSYDSAGRPSNIVGPQSAGSTNPSLLFDATAYIPSGALAAAQLGSGISFQRTYNNRLLPTGENDTQGTAPGVAAVQINGVEQVDAYSSGSITFGGAEQCSGSNCDAGLFIVTIGSGQPIQIQYGQSSTPSSLASLLASEITCSGDGVQAGTSGGTVYLQSCGSGTNTNYQIQAYPDGHSSSFAQYSFSVSKSGSSMTPIINASTTGSNVIAFAGTEQNGQTGNYGFFVWPYPNNNNPPLQYVNVNWGSGSTPTTLAAAVAAALGSCSSGQAVQGVAVGSNVYLASCQGGLSFSVSTNLNSYSGGSGPSFTASAGSAQLANVIFSGAEQGGQSGTFGLWNGPAYSGTLMAEVNWNSSSTPATLAAGLVSALGSCSSNGNSMVGLASGATVFLVPCQSSTASSISIVVLGCGCSQGGPVFSATATQAGPSLPPVPTGAVYDSGFVSLVVNGTQVASTAYGSSSTPASIAAGLSNASLNNDLVTVQANGNTLTITGEDDGTGMSYSYALNIQSSNQSTFAVPSFVSSAPSGSLQGGENVPLYSWSINSYAPNGDVLSMTDSVMGAWSYTYDDLNRLITGGASAGPMAGMNLSWDYDRYGNRWHQNASGNGSAVQTQFTFSGNNNRIDQFSGNYDLDGNLLNDGTNQYVYDAENRIASLNGQAMYIYDAEGTRVAKLATGGALSAVYIVGLKSEQVTEINGSGQWVHTNVYAAGGRLLATYVGPGGSAVAGYHYHLTDWLGTERVQTNANGSLDESCQSYPFGDGLSCLGPRAADATEQHFTGKERDVETGLDYFGARYLSSNFGRFMTPDWASKPAAVPYASFGDPQTLNLYGYVQNNPNTGIDADGHWATSGFCVMGVPCGADPTGDYSDYLSWKGEQDLADSDAWEKQQKEAASQAAPPPPGPANPSPSDPAQQQEQYTAALLGKPITVTISAATIKQIIAISEKLDAALADINSNASKLTTSELQTIHNINSISVGDNARSGMDVETGDYHMMTSYVMGSGTAWLASTIAHDAYHITQYQHGEVYGPSTAPRMEHDANQFQIRVGVKLGLTQSDVNYLRQDKHTLYNTNPY